MILQKHKTGVFQALCSLLFCLFSSSCVCSVIRKLPLQVQTEPVEQQTNWCGFLFYLKIFKPVYTINQIIWKVTVAAICKLVQILIPVYITLITVILILKVWSIEIALMFLMLKKAPPTSMVISITIIHSRRSACFSFRWFRIRSVSSIQCWSFSFITYKPLQTSQIWTPEMEWDHKIGKHTP